MFEWFKFVDCCRNFVEWKIVKRFNTFVIKAVLRNQGRAVTNILEEQSENLENNLFLRKKSGVKADNSEL